MFICRGLYPKSCSKTCVIYLTTILCKWEFIFKKICGGTSPFVFTIFKSLHSFHSYKSYHINYSWQLFFFLGTLISVITSFVWRLWILKDLYSLSLMCYTYLQARACSLSSWGLFLVKSFFMGFFSNVSDLISSSLTKFL